MTKDDFIYALKTCEYTVHNGQVMYAEEDLIKRFDELPSVIPSIQAVEDIKKERYNNGFYDGYKKATKQANAVIGDIKTEIEEVCGSYGWDDYDFCSGLIMARKIIDKHTKAEMEGEE